MKRDFYHNLSQKLLLNWISLDSKLQILMINSFFLCFLSLIEQKDEHINQFKWHVFIETPNLLLELILFTKKYEFHVQWQQLVLFIHLEPNVIYSSIKVYSFNTTFKMWNFISKKIIDRLKLIWSPFLFNKSLEIFLFNFKMRHLFSNYH